MVQNNGKSSPAMISEDESVRIFDSQSSFQDREAGRIWPGFKCPTGPYRHLSESGGPEPAPGMNRGCNGFGCLDSFRGEISKRAQVPGCWFHPSPKSNSSCFIAGCCEACGQPPTCGQGGGNA